jgi:hypothetical protein
LVSFVVLDGSLPLKELREYAEAELPDYMVPSHFIALPAIPASDHGKRDVAALQELLDKYRERQENHVAPVTETERYLAALWESLLGAEGVGSNDDFFELGGHSLLAFRVQSRIKRELGVTLEYRTLLGNPVLADVAAEIDEARSEVGFQ